jgi:hypothetical protein
MRFESYGAAGKHAAEKKESLAQGPERNFSIPHFAIGPEFPEYMMDLYMKIESEGAVDYGKFAKEMWEYLTGEPAGYENSYFREFEHGMIRDLHGIDISKLMYPHVKESLPELISRWSESVHKVMLWSIGDVSGTGYQVQKIRSSGIVPQFMRNLSAELGSEKARAFLEKKTEYMVDDDKFDRLGEYLARELPQGEVKIVIIEDSPENFEKARNAVRARFGAAADRIQIIPIWAVYSFRGKKEEAKAKTPEAQAAFWEKKHALHAINSFEELLDDKHKGLMKDAYLLVDFDGVIGNNAEMRKKETEAVYNNFIHAYANFKNVSISAAEARIRERFKK